MSTLLVAMCLALAACQPGLEDEVCPPKGTALTYENFGRVFFDRECQTCHRSGAPDRHGAPSDYTFNDVESIRRWADEIYDRSAVDNPSMPPGPDDPTPEEREDLAEWLACGAPDD